MNPLRIHLQLIGMAILWGASWPWGRVVAQAMPTFVASSLRFFVRDYSAHDLVICGKSLQICETT